jgi:hypothetical protein
MEPVSLIVGALAAGAGSGLTEATSSAVQEAYHGLRDRLRRRFAGKQSAELVLAEYEQDPQTWEQPLREAVAGTGAAQDAAVVEAAQRLLGLLDAAGSAAGKYQVDASHAQGVQVGDDNVQHNVFGRPGSDSG